MRLPPIRPPAKKVALNIIRSYPDKTSILGKIKRAGWENAFLIELICHMR